MKRFRWQILTLGLAIATVVGGVVAAPASGATGVTATFTKTSEWSSGYEAKYTISNGGSSALTSWTVEFTLPSGQSIGSLWDGSHTASGQNITVRSTWNGNVPVGGSASFGFTVSGSGGSPSNCKVNGGSCDGTGQPPTTTTTTTTTTTSNPPVPGTGRGAPYLYLGWGNPQSATQVMSSTGVKWFTLAFVLSGGGCTPSWDSQRPLTGGVDQQTINSIRAAGGDIVPSFGGWSGNKLGPNCSTPEALAGAYQQVINAYGLKAIDIDIENSDEFENTTVQDRIITALKIVKQNNPGIQTIVTFGTGTTGPNFYGARLIDQSKALGANIDIFTIMPFDFGSSNIRTDTIGAATGLKNKLKSTFGWSDAEAFKHVGISGMNGLSDQRELTTVDDWTAIRDWAKSNGLGRLAFWSVNRDRGGCDGQVAANCSGIQQADLAFTRVTAGF
ncbi:cellulose binding domain-containing protein [Lentzea flava]|uniref:Chitinase n=1 Tax=Lentzea flava TaxID=103732 RepID=A0ABQ2UX88_9PSEU|nr:cellulose binding domain-containing protein [Lentzea flava]MCP2202270.1 Cellulose binding domain-containing protein [Lentzea flava]GGU58523.1 chitinase [Lentzea flava]